MDNIYVVTPCFGYLVDVFRQEMATSFQGDYYMVLMSLIKMGLKGFSVYLLSLYAYEVPVLYT